MRAIAERQSTSEQIVGVLALPSPRAASLERACPLPIPELHRLPRDESMLYGIGRVDASGRVADRDIIEALGWKSGDSVEVVATPQAIVIRAAPEGLLRIPRRPCVVIPAQVRHHHGISPGDHVLLAAAPDHGVVVVHTLADLDIMLSEYHSCRAATNRP
jgi:bifunctional DNA-binding transcriptional regulator/antitoxin component of YhaV-PrlF toxin-antitoxin module